MSLWSSREQERLYSHLEQGSSGEDLNEETPVSVETPVWARPVLHTGFICMTVKPKPVYTPPKWSNWTYRLDWTSPQTECLAGEEGGGMPHVPVTWQQHASDETVLEDSGSQVSDILLEMSWKPAFLMILSMYFIHALKHPSMHFGGRFAAWEM